METIRQVKGKIVIPICPEVFGGLTTPRIPAEIVLGKDQVINRAREDVTKEYTLGAMRTLQVLEASKCHKAILKELSPACGTNRIYDGTFSKTQVPGMGIAARHLHASGIELSPEIKSALR